MVMEKKMSDKNKEPTLNEDLERVEDFLIKNSGYEALFCAWYRIRKLSTENKKVYY